MTNTAKFLLVLACCGACSGGRHARGDRQVVTALDWGEPTSGSAGRAQSVGLSAQGQWFVFDRWAPGVKTTVRRYNEVTGPITAVEFEATSRHYLFEVGPLGFLFDITGGVSIARDPVPFTGNSTNFVVGAGPAIEIPLSEKLDLLFGYQYRLLTSVEGGGSSDNPGQEDHRFWVGLGFDW